MDTKVRKRSKTFAIGAAAATAATAAAVAAPATPAAAGSVSNTCYDSGGRGYAGTIIFGGDGYVHTVQFKSASVPVNNVHLAYHGPASPYWLTTEHLGSYPAGQWKTRYPASRPPFGWHTHYAYGYSRYDVRLAVYRDGINWSCSMEFNGNPWHFA